MPSQKADYISEPLIGPLDIFVFPRSPPAEALSHVRGPTQPPTVWVKEIHYTHSPLLLNTHHWPEAHPRRAWELSPGAILPRTSVVQMRHPFVNWEYLGIPNFCADDYGPAIKRIRGSKFKDNANEVRKVGDCREGESQTQKGMNTEKRACFASKLVTVSALFKLAWKSEQQQETVPKLTGDIVSNVCESVHFLRYYGTGVGISKTLNIIPFNVLLTVSRQIL